VKANGHQNGRGDRKAAVAEHPQKRGPNGHKNGKAVPRPSTILQPVPTPSAQAIAMRFGRILGKRFTRKNLAILGQAHAAVTGLKKSQAAIRGRGANIFTQWVGDPDALGSALMLKAILKKLGAKEVRILTGGLGHPQNRNLVQRCGIELHDPNEERLPRGLHCMVDTSPPLGMANTGRVDSVPEYFFVADHHADPADVEHNCATQGVRQVKHAFVGLPVGSTSSFLAAMGLAFDLWDDVGPEGRAAVALGIYTDTSALLHNAQALDFRMFEKLTRDEETQDVLDELRDYRVPEDWFRYRIAAIQYMQVTGAVRIAPVGYVREDHRDVIAEISNDLLRIEGTSIGISIAVTERGTEVSVRADSRLLRSDRARIVKVIDHLLGYVFPGTSGFKHDRRPPHRVEGGACVPHSQAEERLWKLEAKGGGGTGTDAMLEHCRACARALVAALKDLRDVNPEEIQGLL
jgi:nanoRNase/pAp phosphatase (c-di-AMP/oligoRNAs hydrolase)